MKSRLSLSIVAVAACMCATPGVAHAFCPITGCGSNTPILFGTPIIGLSAEGIPNAEGVILNSRLTRVAGTSTRPACDTGATLRVRDGALIGGKDGAECPAAEMIGMAFWISVPLPHCRAHQCNERKQVQIRIDQVASVQTWEVTASRPVPTLRLVWHNLDEAGDLAPEARVGESICPLREAWMEDWQKPSVSVDPLKRRVWKEETDHLLIVQGETYQRDATVDPTRVGAAWFNIACVGTAIAKMRLLGYDPMGIGGFTTREERQATLKMLTARYRTERSYTSKGVPLRWIHYPSKEFEGTPAEWIPSRIESYWGKDGALCLTHRRTWRASGASPDWRRTLEDAMPEATAMDRPRVMPELSLESYIDAEERSLVELRDTPLALRPCNRVRPVGAYWATYAVEHTRHGP
jgi:hypothetical protein